MMENYRIVMSALAYSDLQSIHKYISKDSANHAAKMIERILDSIQLLVSEPHHTIVEFPRRPRPARKLPVQSYVVYYEIHEVDRVRILRVWHGARRPPTELE